MRELKLQFLNGTSQTNYSQGEDRYSSQSDRINLDALLNLTNQLISSSSPTTTETQKAVIKESGEEVEDVLSLDAQDLVDYLEGKEEWDWTRTSPFVISLVC